MGGADDNPPAVERHPPIGCVAPSPGAGRLKPPTVLLPEAISIFACRWAYLQVTGVATCSDSPLGKAHKS